MRFAVRVAVRPRVVRAWFVACLAIVSIGTARGDFEGEFEGDFVSLLRGVDADATEEMPLSDDRNRGRRLLACSNTCEAFASIGCSCNDGTYKNKVNNVDCSCGFLCSGKKYSCYSCDSSCRKCYGGGSSACTACDDGKYLSSGQCKSCHVDCKTCYGGGESYHCTSCKESGSKPHLSVGVCWDCESDSECEAREFCQIELFRSAGTCVSCHASCATCTQSSGSTQSVCTACDDPINMRVKSNQAACVECLDGNHAHCANNPNRKYCAHNDECVVCLGPSGCEEGYTCRGTGSAASCDPDSCDASALPAHASDAGDCPASLPSGDTCSPTCASGYTRNGVTSCLAGTLTSATCDPDPCDASALPANAVDPGDCTATLSSGSSCEPTCVLGYVASAARCFAGNLTAAACDREPSCDASALPAGASDLGDCNATLPSRSSCSPTCDDGYTLTAASECVAGTLTPATCEETPTPPPPPLTPPPPARPSLVFEDDESRAKRAGAHTASAFACATVAAVLAA